MQTLFLSVKYTRNTSLRISVQAATGRKQGQTQTRVAAADQGNKRPSLSCEMSSSVLDVPHILL